MTRFLVILVLSFLIWRGLRRLVVSSLGRRPGSPRSRPAATAPPPAPRRRSEAGQLVRCSSCGAHFPLERALPARGGLYCSAQCRETLASAAASAGASDRAARG